MTGFGEAARQWEGVDYALEVRSVNNRYFKGYIRVPESLLSMEAELESLLRKRLSRGTVTLSVSFKDTSASAAHDLNSQALGRYLDHLKQIEEQAVGGESDRWGLSIDLASLMTLPGVIQPPSQTQLVERVRPVLLPMVHQACEKLEAMRQREGEGLRQDLLNHRREIGRRLQWIEQRTPQVVQEYHQRLKSRVDQLLSEAEMELSQTDLLREVAVYAERCDVSEELQRLKAHLEQFEQILHAADDAPSGRTLEFVAQEMLREANTIAGKSNDAEISRIIVEIKGSIDRIKEQVQNVE